MGEEALAVMWFFPTHKRPRLAQRLVDACVETGMTSPGLVVIDGSYEDYPSLRLPPNIQVIATGARLEFCGVLRWLFTMFQHEPFYGLICDDAIPRTRNWDKALEYAAGDWYTSCADDLLGRPDYWSYGAIGGKLLRAIGYWAPPDFIHLYIDGVWTYLFSELGVIWRCPDVIIEEMHFSNGKGAFDATYERVFNGVDYAGADQAVWKRWHTDPATQDTINRVRLQVAGGMYA